MSNTKPCFDSSSVRLVCSVSGGKDSAATALYLQELGIEYESIFMDTGWEHPSTYDYVREQLEPRVGPIRWLRSQRGGMVDLVKHKAMFPSRVMRWCTQELKISPAQAYFKEAIEHELASESPRWLLNVTGIRADESANRSKMPEWEQWGADQRGELPVIVWRPILRWSEQDVIDIHKRHGLPPNPLYLLGASRVGCWPCIHARKKEIALIGKIDPQRIDTIRELEADATARARERARVRSLTPWPATLPPLADALQRVRECRAKLENVDGIWESDLDQIRKELRDAEELAELVQSETDRRDPEHERHVLTYFQPKSSDPNVIPTIDRILEWANASKNRDQLPLFDDPSDGARDGCMRWGMCETAQGSDDE